MVATCGRVRPALGDRARRTAPAQCRQGAGRTRVVPAGAPAGLGPVSTGGAILVRRWTPLFDERIEGPRERRPHGEPRSNGPCGGSGAYHRAMPVLRVALVQLEARDDVDDNIARAAALAAEAAVGADLVVLPEYVQYRGSEAGFRASARAIPGPTTAPFERVAREHGTWVLAGSHAEASSDPERPFNTAVLLDRAGALAATYRKLHLFDVAVDDGPSDTESARVTPGDRAVVADVDGIGLGLSICYDLRFPELYRALALAGAGVLGGAGGVHRAHRARPLGGPAAGARDRERRVGDRGGRLRRRRTRGDPGLGALDGRRPVGARSSRRRRWTRGSCGRSWTSTRSTRHAGRSRSSRTAGPRPCHRPGRSSAPPSSDRCPEGGREQATGPGLRRPTPSPPDPSGQTLAGHPWGRGASPIGVTAPGPVGQ